ncbi:MAG TPA: TonB-dependent receptor [Bacteroidota bacterium]
MNRCEEIRLRLLRTISLGILLFARMNGQIDTLSVFDLKMKSLEDLMQMEITTVSKRAEPLLNVPAGVHVITQEDIRRSGVTTLAEALRLAPNLNVAQIDARQWAISARGFNGSTSNKLLVLIDGRVIYTPLYSGVFWDVQHVYLDDIERIEVVSGPGGTLWGANAVNGIINVITKSSNDRSTQGFHAYGGVGTEKAGFAGARYGGAIGQKGSVRVYGMWQNQKETILGSGLGANDDWNFAQGGFRSDWSLGEAHLVVQGDLYKGRVDQPIADDIDLQGGNVLVNYDFNLSPISKVAIKAYADMTHRRIPGTFGEDLGTFDIDAQHSVILESHSIVWGVGLRHFNDRVVNSTALAFLPDRQKFSLVTAFVQDKIDLVSDFLSLMIGSKFERNHYTGYEVQPSVRLSLTLSSSQFLWGAVSRAVRTPSRIDRELFAPGNPPYIVIAGGPGFKSESVIAYALGYRFSSPGFSLDALTFFNSYDDLRSLEPGPPPVLSNGLEAESYGAEVAVQYQLTDWWRVRTGYSLFQKEVRLKPWSADLNNGQAEGNDPRHRVKFHSLMDLPGNVTADAWIRYVDKLPNRNAVVPGFLTMDVQIGIGITENVSVSIVGQHLLQKSHPEFGAPATRKEFERQVFLRASLTL